MKYLQCSVDEEESGKTQCCGEKKTRYCCTLSEWNLSNTQALKHKENKADVSRPWDLTFAVYPQAGELNEDMSHLLMNDDTPLLVITKDDIEKLPWWAVALIVIGALLLGGCVLCLAVDCLCKLLCCSWAAVKNCLLCLCCCGGCCSDKSTDEERLVLVHNDHHHNHYHKGGKSGGKPNHGGFSAGSSNYQQVPGIVTHQRLVPSTSGAPAMITISSGQHTIPMSNSNGQMATAPPLPPFQANIYPRLSQ